MGSTYQMPGMGLGLQSLIRLALLSTCLQSMQKKDSSVVRNPRVKDTVSPMRAGTRSEITLKSQKPCPVIGTL